MRSLTWGFILLGVVTFAGRTSADDAAEIAQIKQAIADLQKRLQALEEKQQKGADNQGNALPPVQAGYGKIKLGGLLQTWVSADNGATLNSFRLRRMELNISGEITPKITWRTMFDVAKVLSLNVTTAGGNVTGVSVNQASRVLQDMLISYALTPELAVDVGQYKVPMSLEGLRSSAELYTVERAIFNTLPARNGRVGDIREPGVQLRGKYPHAEFAFGIFNDGGPRQNDVDDNEDKTLIGRFAFKPAVKNGQSLLFSVYGAKGKTSTALTKRDRLGGEVAYAFGRHVVELEFVDANDATVRGRGGYIFTKSTTAGRALSAGNGGIRIAPSATMTRTTGSSARTTSSKGRTPRFSSTSCARTSAEPHPPIWAHHARSCWSTSRRRGRRLEPLRKSVAAGLYACG